MRFSESQIEVIPILQLLKISVGVITSELFFLQLSFRAPVKERFFFGKTHPTKNYPTKSSGQKLRVFPIPKLSLLTSRSA